MTHVLRERALSAPAEVALADGDTSYSWGELADVCEQAVQALASLHLATGQRVAVIARNAAPTAVVYLMARFSGVQIVAASFHLTAKEISYILNDGNVGAVFCDESTRSNVVAAARELGISHVFTIDGDAGSDVARAFVPWVQKFDAVEPDLSVAAAPNVLYTSGTTGFPKGVMNPQLLTCSVREHVEDYREPVDIGPYLMVGPMYHAGTLGILRRLTGGRPVIVMKQFTALGALQAIQRYGITGTTMVPTHFSRLLDVPNEVRTACDVSSLTLLDHTGSSCPVAVKEAMINWMGPILVDRYGGTEAGTVCTITSLEWLQYKGSAGKCLPRFSAHVVDDNDVEVPIGQVGRLYFIDHSGEGVVYLNAPEKTAAAHIRPGVFTLGDLGYVNEEGYVFVTGRTADTVVSGGVNLYPAEIERVLLDCPGVHEAAVVGVPDTEMGESLLACIVREDAGLNEADIILFAREVLAGPKVPRKFVFVEELPRNPVGKLDRKVLREMHAKN